MGEQIEKAEAEGLKGVQQAEGEGPPETSLPFSMLQVRAVAVNRTIGEANLSAAEQIEKAEAEGVKGVQQAEGEGPPETSLPFSMLQVKAVAVTEKTVDAAVDSALFAKNATSDLERQKGGFGK